MIWVFSNSYYSNYSNYYYIVTSHIIRFLYVTYYLSSVSVLKMLTFVNFFMLKNLIKPKILLLFAILKISCYLKFKNLTKPDIFILIFIDLLKPIILAWHGIILLGHNLIPKEAGEGQFCSISFGRLCPAGCPSFVC